MNEHTTNSSTPPAITQVILLWALRLFALAAFGLAGYLSYQSWTQAELVGCGGGSPCEQVLNSRYAKLLGLPIAIPAALTYVCTIVLSFLLVSSNMNLRKWAGRGLNLLALAIFTSAIAYILIQLILLKAICPYCMTEHGLGIICVALILSLTWKPDTAILQDLIAPGAAGLILMTAVLGIQSIQPAPRTTAVIITDIKGDHDTGPGPDRQITILEEKLTVRVDESIVMGDPNAEHMIVMFFDYACLHCRNTHHMVQSIIDQDPKRLAVILAPTPINGNCNPLYKDFDAERFKHSCTLAMIGLTVNAADKSKIKTFDDWMFSPQYRPEPEQARAKAIELIGEQAFKEHYNSEALKARQQKYIDAFAHLAQLRQSNPSIPILMAPKFPTHMGKFTSEEKLLEILEKELFKQNQKTNEASTP